MTIVALLAALGLAASSAGGGAAPTRAIEPAFDTKKKCKYVIKIVHGHKRRVRVCHTVKPPPPPPPKAGDVVGSVSLGSDGQSAVVWLAAADGAVWATRADTDVARVDPSSMTVVAKIISPLLEFPPLVTVGLGSVWISDGIPATDARPQSGQIRRVDEATNSVVATIPVGRTPEDVAFTPGAAWVANHRSDELEGTPGTHTFSLSRIDPAANKEVARVPVEYRADTFDSWSNFCCGLSQLIVAEGSLWVGDAAPNTVYRVDPQSSHVIAAIPAPVGTLVCGDIVGDSSGIWVAGCEDSPAWRIDPSTNTGAVVKKSLTSIGPIAVGFGSIWLVGKDTLLRVDPATGAVVAKNKIVGANSLAIGNGFVWVSQGATILKLKPA